VQVNTEAASEAATVAGDETRVKQVLTNLLSNAVKYNREGGSVVVSTRRSGDTVEVSVRDTGLGMTPAQVAALFQPYNRLGREHTAIEGTGIGLVISRRLAELMGGALEVSSSAGQGSVFTLRLRAAGTEGGSALPAEETPKKPYQRRLVHYVEDNETNVEVMRGILLQRPQVRLEVSTIGLDGLSAIRRERPDLILLDMQLPDISGLELLRHIKQDDDVAGIPVIVVSADATTARMQEALTLGAAHYVTKPVDIQRFLKKLDETLEVLETRWG
jgi:CheY-like chemotaxis protein/anti-sigma regulatory factor (Ser/Thr protein kinase)